MLLSEVFFLTFILHIAYVLATQSDPEHKSSRDLDRKATATEHQLEVEMQYK